MHLTSRLRRDTALFATPSPTRQRQRRRGRPRTIGRPLPTPQKIAGCCRSWQKATVNRRGTLLDLLAYSNRFSCIAFAPDNPSCHRAHLIFVEPSLAEWGGI
jgi:hypothetical protein